MSKALLFGAAKSFVNSLEKNFDVNIVILEMHNVPIIDTTGAVAIENIVERLLKDKKRLIIVGLRPTVRKVLYDLGVTRAIGIGNFLPSITEAIDYALMIAKNQGEKARCICPTKPVCFGRRALCFWETQRHTTPRRIEAAPMRLPCSYSESLIAVPRS